MPVATPGWYRAAGMAAVGPVTGSWRGGQAGSWWDYSGQQLPAGLYKVEVRSGEAASGGGLLRVKYQDAGALV